MKKTGELLKKVREEKGLSLHEIGLSLKINPKILKQIEEGEKDNLPAKTFLRGFVQSYANFLKLDSDEVLRIFSEEMGSTKPQKIPTGSVGGSSDPQASFMTISEPREEGAPASSKTNPNAYNKKDFEFKNFGIGALVILLLLSLIGVRKVVEKYQKESEVEPPKISQQDDSVNSNPIPTGDMNSSQTMDNPMVVNQPTPQISNQPVTAPSIAATNTPAATSTTASAAHTVTVPHPQTSPTVAANPATVATAVPHPVPSTKPTTSRSSVSTNTATTVPMAVTTPTVSQTSKPTTNTQVSKPNVTPTTTATPVPTPPVAATTKPEETKKPKNVEVVIQALDSVDVEVTLSSGKSEVIKLSPSQTQTIKSQTGVKLNFSNGGAVNLIVNGKDVGVPGDLGKPKKVSF